MCGVVGVIGLPKKQTLGTILLYMSLQQNRGQQGSGIYLTEFSSNQEPFHLQAPGLVSRLVNIIDETLAHGWPSPVGDIGIGHLRYSTSGTDDPAALQPRIVEIDNQLVVFAFNGNLVQWKKKARDLGLGPQITDTEFIIELLKRSNNTKRPIERIYEVFSELKGAFSAVIIWDDCLYAVRDPAMFRPLWLGQCNGGWVVASEDGAIRHARGKVTRFINAGEILQITTNGPGESLTLPRNCQKNRCVMCATYFGRPDSTTTSQTKSNAMIRFKHGKLLAQAWVDSGSMPKIDCVIPMVASGLNAANGVMWVLRIEPRFAINRNPYLGRNFLQERETANDQLSLKHSVDPFMVEGMRVAVVDDSVIRGRTAKKTIRDLREAGAQAVNWLVASPPYRACCHYGLDTPFTQELIAHCDGDDLSVEEISKRMAEIIGADSVFYLPLDVYISSFSSPEHCCFSCFTGQYPEDNLPDEDDITGQRTNITAAVLT